jgi:polysaccharide export outer membrane protein
MRISRKAAGLTRPAQPRGVLILALTVLAASISAGHAFAGSQVLPVPKTDYRIGSNDLLEITVFELPELHQIVRVSEDGSISLALIGKVDVARLTAQELEAKLATILDQKFTKGAHVTVFVKEFQKVAVLGAVTKPGMYELAGPTTLIQMIANAGGLTAQAMNKILVYRQASDGKKSTILIAIDELIMNVNPDFNLSLQPKDVVFVPVDQILNVFVYGEVKNPGIIAFLSSKSITVLQAITQAGGPTEWAKTGSVSIKRKERETGKEIKIEVNLRAVINGKAGDIALLEGDIVIVP